MLYIEDRMNIKAYNSRNSSILTASPIFLAIFESVIFAKGLSAPQHSTYFVIFDEGLVLFGMPGVAIVVINAGITEKG